MWKSVTETSFKEQNITTPSDIMAKFNIVKTFHLPIIGYNVFKL